MPCLCVKNKTWTNLTQEQIQEYLIKELRVPQNGTGLAKNKLISRSDPRQSSTTLGIVGLVIMCCMLGLLLLSDMPHLILNIRAALTGKPDLILPLERRRMKRNFNRQLRK